MMKIWVVLMVGMLVVSAKAKTNDVIIYNQYNIAKADRYNPEGSYDYFPFEQVQPDYTLPNAHTDIQSMLTAINAVRAQGQVCRAVYFPPAPPLKWNHKLQQAAQLHANEMATYNFMSHIGLDGRKFDERIKAQNQLYWAASENLSAGHKTINDTLNAWLTSQSGHCENLMNPEFSDVGMAYSYNAKAKYFHYWAQLFIKAR